MRRSLLISAGVLLFLVVFWLGLMANFPGAALSRLVESRINGMSGVKASLSPAKLGLLGISVESLKLSWSSGKRQLPLVTFNDVYVPLSWRLNEGIPLQAAIGEEGWLDLFLAWDGGVLDVEGAEIELADIPVWKSIKDIKLKGLFSLKGSLSFPKGNKRRKGRGMPTGTIGGTGKNLEISSIKVMGASLPPARLESLEIKIKSGKNINVERFVFKGDMQGSVTGSITPNGNNLERSALRLQIATSFRQGWLNSLGTLKPLLEAFLTDGRLKGSINGTVGKPNWRKG